LGAWLIILTIPLGIVGGAFIFFIGTSLQGILPTLLGVLLGLGLAAWGWALWSEKGEVVGASQTRDVSLIRSALASGFCWKHWAG